MNEEHIINDIILLPKDTFNEEEAEKIIARIHNLPPSLLKKIKDNGIYLHLFTTKLTDFPTTYHLKGLVPRGYTNGITWDDLPGIGGSHVVLVKIGHSDKGEGHGSINLELHELAHSIDTIVFNGIRSKQHFLKIWEKEREQLFPNQRYLTNFPEEYFAEAFAYYYLNQETRNYLRNKAEETFHFIASLK